MLGRWAAGVSGRQLCSDPAARKGSFFLYSNPRQLFPQVPGLRRAQGIWSCPRDRADTPGSGQRHVPHTPKCTGNLGHRELLLLCVCPKGFLEVVLLQWGPRSWESLTSKVKG